MSDECRIVVGLEQAIMFSEQLIDEAYYKVPREQVFHFTTNHRKLLKAQVRFHAHLTGQFRER